MNSEWRESETTTHQDHVIAHVIDATALAYFIFDETLHLLLDIGFIWSIYLDGQMVLLPHGVAVSELEMQYQTRAEIAGEVESVLSGSVDDLKLVTSIEITIASVGFYENGERWRMVLSDDESEIVIEASIAERTLQVRL